MAVEPLADEGEEERPGRERPRVDRHAARLLVGPSPDDPPSNGRDDPARAQKLRVPFGQFRRHGCHTRSPRVVSPAAAAPLFARAARASSPVAERPALVADDLVVFVPLPGQHDRVARARPLDRSPDRLPPVRDDEVVPPRCPASLAHARLDLGENPDRVFGPGIVRRQNDEVGRPRRRQPHLGPFAPVPVAAAAEQDGEPPRRDFPAAASRRESASSVWA